MSRNDVYEPVSAFESKELLQLCRAGRLYDVEKWIVSGKSIRVSEDCRETPLDVAFELGFHSLIELLLRHSDQSEKNKALELAVFSRRLDLVELCFEYGADFRSVSFTEVLLEWKPSVIRLFLEKGADFITDSPFAEAFREKRRTALGPYLDCKREHPEFAEKLQEQADRALRHFAVQGNLKWISLMLWLGANPRSRGPMSDLIHSEDDPESWTTAIEQACWKGHLDIVKHFAPEKGRDDLERLLREASWAHSREILSYLLDLGANPNDKENGASSVVDHLLHLLPWGDSSHLLYSSPASSWKLRNVFQSLEELFSRGARWEPDPDTLASLRRNLRRCEPQVTIDFLELVLKFKAGSRKTIDLLLKTPKMKVHLHFHRTRLEDLFANYEKKASAGGAKPGEKTARPHYFTYEFLQKYSREKLYEEVWAEPVRTVARRYGVSDVALKKTCKKLQVPVPGRGYWAKKSAGRAVPKRPKLGSLG